MSLDFDELLTWARQHHSYWQEDLRIMVSLALNDEMKRQGVTKAELARRLETKPSYITKILGGYQNLSLDSLAKVAFHLGLRWEPRLAPIEQKSSKPATKQKPAAKKKHARTEKAAPVAAMRRATVKKKPRPRKAVKAVA